MQTSLCTITFVRLNSLVSTADKVFFLSIISFFYSSSSNASTLNQLELLGVLYESPVKDSFDLSEQIITKGVLMNSSSRECVKTEPATSVNTGLVVKNAKSSTANNRLQSTDVSMPVSNITSLASSSSQLYCHAGRLISGQESLTNSLATTTKPDGHESPSFENTVTDHLTAMYNMVNMQQFVKTYPEQQTIDVTENLPTVQNKDQNIQSAFSKACPRYGNICFLRLVHCLLITALYQREKSWFL